MRYLFGFICVCALGAMPLVGCSETAGDGGSGGSAGAGGIAACVDNVCPCTEGGIRAAIEAGGNDPYTFDCDGPETVVTEREIVIDNDVILDGDENLTVDGEQVQDGSPVFSVNEGITAELTGFTVTAGSCSWERGCSPAVIDNSGRLTLTSSVLSNNQGGVGIENFAQGTVTLTNCAVSGNNRSGIYNLGTLTMTNTTVSGNSAWLGGGIENDGTLTLTNSTVSGNDAEEGGGGIFNWGTLTLTNSTVSGNRSLWVGAAGIDNHGTLTLTNTTVSANVASNLGPGIYNEMGTLTIASSTVSGNTGWDGNCAGDVTSLGYNIESPGDTCGFDQGTDQVGVSADDLNLGELANNGGPTETHALRPGSVAIDQIPTEECLDADGEPLTTDQRGFPRDSMCDVGAFEVQP